MWKRLSKIDPLSWCWVFKQVIWWFGLIQFTMRKFQCNSIDSSKQASEYFEYEFFLFEFQCYSRPWPIHGFESKSFRIRVHKKQIGNKNKTTAKVNNIKRIYTCACQKSYVNNKHIFFTCISRTNHLHSLLLDTIFMITHILWNFKQ